MKKKKFDFWNKYSPEENKEFWDNSLIVFDTNILLALYRISPELSRMFFELSNKIKERIFIPLHVMEEFHLHRYEVINNNFTTLSNLKKEISTFEKEIISTNIYNYFSSQTKKVIKDELSSKSDRINSRENYFKSLEKNDSIYIKLMELLEGKITKGFTEKELKKIKEEGIERYKKEIPPGYTDNNKENNKYGDLIIWKDIIRKAQKTKSNIVLVSNEKKEDWIWIMKNKKIIGPRPELKEEFYTQAKAKFQISNLENFILGVAITLGNEVDINSIKKEFKLESIFENNLLNVKAPSLKNSNQNEEVIKLQEERNNIQKLIEDIVGKPNVNEKEKQLLEDLRFRRNMIDETIKKSFSKQNNK